MRDIGGKAIKPIKFSNVKTILKIVSVQNSKAIVERVLQVHFVKFVITMESNGGSLTVKLIEINVRSATATKLT